MSLCLKTEDRVCVWVWFCFASHFYTSYRKMFALESLRVNFVFILSRKFYISHNLSYYLPPCWRNLHFVPSCYFTNNATVKSFLSGEHRIFSFCTPASLGFYYINITCAHISRKHVWYAYAQNWHYIRKLSHLVLFWNGPLPNYSHYCYPVVSSSSYENWNTQMWSPCRKCSCPTATERFGSSLTMLNMIFGWVSLYHWYMQQYVSYNVNWYFQNANPSLYLAENVLGHVKKRLTRVQIKTNKAKIQLELVVYLIVEMTHIYFTLFTVIFSVLCAAY